MLLNHIHKCTRYNPLIIIKPSTSSLSSPYTSLLNTTKLIHNYHMSYLMDSKHDDRFVKIDRRAFHLYKDSILNFPQQPFNQKIFLTILIDTVRTKQQYKQFQQLAIFGLQNINQFKQPLSIFSFATQMYLYNYPNKQQSYILAKKGFQFFKTHPTMKYSSYYVMKFLIFVQKNVGLQKFTDEDYKLINFTRFKPLFLCFTLEMFYQNKLQHYSTIQYLFELFTSSQSIIPFADIHHYKLATKRVVDVRFKEFVDNLSKRLIEQKDDNNGDNNNQIKLNSRSFNNNNNSINDNVSSKKQTYDENNNNEQRGQNNGLSKVGSRKMDNKQSNQQQSSQKQSNQQQSSQQQSSQKQSYPWQQAYNNHILRQFTYYPAINYHNTQHKSHIKKN